MFTGDKGKYQGTLRVWMTSNESFLESKRYHKDSLFSVDLLKTHIIGSLAINECA